MVSMHLLNTETRELETFEGHDIPAYAVLSHTWASPQEEILFQDLSGTRTWYSTTGPPPDSPKAAGWKKLNGACRQASCDGLQYVWIDTCCIDKSSSAELSEAIISMYRWYAHSVVCYAYLADVYAGTDPRSDQAMDDFRESRWFTRGWTLQEFLAPADVRFFDARWVNLGGKHMLCDTISAITGINPRCISGLPDGAHGTGSPWDPQHFIATASVAEKMSWAASRQTTRLEDMTYCLLGIFDVTMPILYGEGDRAFQRLQENIMGATEDCTLLAWSYQVGWPQPSGAWNEMKPSILAPSVAAFRHCRGLIPRKIPRHKRPTFSMTPRGLKLKLPVLTDRWHKDLAYAILACGPLSPPRSLASFSALNGGDEAYLSFMAIPLVSVTPASDNEVEEYWRPAWSRPTLVTRDFISGTVGVKPKATLKKIIIRRPSPEYDLVQKPWLPVSLVTSSPDTDAILQAYPPHAIGFRCVVSNILPPADAYSSGSLLNKLRRGSKDSRQDSASNAPEKLSYQPTNPRRLIYATVLDLHLLIYLQFGATSTPSETFVQQLHASEWPRKPHIKVFRLPSFPPIEDLHEWYDAKVPPKLPELPGMSTGPSDTEWHYICERADGEVVSFKLSVGYEFREQVDRSGEVTSWDLMPVVKVSHDSEEEGEEADAWSIAETLT